MTTRAKTDTELQAWDIYFAAALEQARHSANGGSTEAYRSNLVKIAGEIADKMLEARRLRA